MRILTKAAAFLEVTEPVCLTDKESQNILQLQRPGLASAQLHMVNIRFEFAE